MYDVFSQAYDREKARKSSLDAQIEPLQVGPELPPISEDVEPSDVRRSSQADAAKKRPTSAASSASSYKQRSDLRNVGSRVDSGKRAQAPRRSDVKHSVSAPNISNQNHRPTSGKQVVSAASKPRPSSSDSNRSNASSRSAVGSARSDRQAPQQSRASPSPRRSRDSVTSSVSSSGDVAADARSKPSRRHSPHASPRTSSRSPPPPRSSADAATKPRALPPRPQGHMRSGSDPMRPHDTPHSPTVSRRRRDSERSAGGAQDSDSPTPSTGTPVSYTGIKPSDFRYSKIHGMPH